MRRLRGLGAILWGACGAGCFNPNPSAPDSFVCLTARNVAEAPLRDSSEVKFIKALHKEAERYWAQTQAADGTCANEPYHEGFVAGFVDYIQAGGTGEPPYLPPFRYRLNHSRTTEGIARVEAWNAGFRNGATVARASGLRDLVLVPLPGPAVPKDLNAPNWLESQPVAPSGPRAGEPSPWDQPGQPPAQLPGAVPPPRLAPTKPDVIPPTDLIPLVPQALSGSAPVDVRRVPLTGPRDLNTPNWAGAQVIVPSDPRPSGLLPRSQPGQQPAQVPGPSSLPVTLKPDVVPPAAQAQNSPGPKDVRRLTALKYSPGPRLTNSPLNVSLMLPTVPQVPKPTGNSTSVQTTSAVVRPTATQPAASSDLWRSPIPPSPLTGSGTH